MSELPVDYTCLAGDLEAPLVAACVGRALLAAVTERYESQCPRCSLVEFVQSVGTAARAARAIAKSPSLTGQQSSAVHRPCSAPVRRRC
jgi:phage FluMu protein Com